MSSETPAQQAERRLHSGKASHESYAETLRRLRPGLQIHYISCVDPSDPATSDFLNHYAGIVFAGSPIQMYKDSVETRAAAAFMTQVFEAGVPSFGSCAGLQIAAVAAGGATGPRCAGMEVAFARDITRTPEGGDHPLLSGRPATWTAPAMHSSVVTKLPSNARVLASNPDTPVEAVELRHRHGIFWGVQYHPELALREIAASLRHQGRDLVDQGLAGDLCDVEAISERLINLEDEAERQDLAWQMGLNDQMTSFRHRTIEIENFLTAVEGGQF